MSVLLTRFSCPRLHSRGWISKTDKASVVRHRGIESAGIIYRWLVCCQEAIPLRSIDISEENVEQHRYFRAPLIRRYPLPATRRYLCISNANIIRDHGRISIKRFSDAFHEEERIPMYVRDRKKKRGRDGGREAERGSLSLLDRWENILLFCQSVPAPWNTLCGRLAILLFSPISEWMIAAQTNVEVTRASRIPI